ncbi:MAG: class I SAM-dependent methyltransferase [Actinobacteria bacterium]|nr:class I SAM-dependent methyltransferase [Actinomycetota bacterium]
MDLASVTARQQAMWATGDFHRIGVGQVGVGERLARSLEIRAGENAFDVVTSTFGAMFAPDQEKTASELLRVARAGGRIGMANWTPEGFIGEMFAVGARYLAPPQGVQPPTRWGVAEGLHALFGDALDDVRIRLRTTDFVYPSPTFMLDYFRAWFGPTATQFAALEPDGQAALADDLLALFQQHNVARDGTVLARGQYLEVVVVKA